MRKVCTAAGPGTVNATPGKRMEPIPFTLPENRLTLGTCAPAGGLSIINLGCAPLATLAFRLSWISVTAIGPTAPPVQTSTRSPTCSAVPPTGMFNGAGLDTPQVSGETPVRENFARKASTLPCHEV